MRACMCVWICVCACMHLYVYTCACVCVCICACMCAHAMGYGRSYWDCLKHQPMSQTAKPLDPYLPFFPNFPLSLLMFLFEHPSGLYRKPWQQVNLHSLPGPMLRAFHALSHFSLITTVGIRGSHLLQTRAWSSLKNLSKASALQRKKAELNSSNSCLVGWCTLFVFSTDLLGLLFLGPTLHQDASGELLFSSSSFSCEGFFFFFFFLRMALLLFPSSRGDERLICLVNLGIPGHAQFSMGLDSALHFGNFPLVFAAPGLGFACMHFWC